MGRRSSRILCIATKQHAIDFLSALSKPLTPNAYESVLDKQIYSPYRNKKERSRLGHNHVHGLSNCSRAVMQECQTLVKARGKWLDDTLTREFYLSLSEIETNTEPEDILFQFSYMGRFAVIELCYLLSKQQVDVADTIVRFSRTVLADELFAALIVGCCWTLKLTGKAPKIDINLINAVALFAHFQSKLKLVRKDLNRYFSSLADEHCYLRLIFNKADAINRDYWFENTYDTGCGVRDLIFNTRLSQVEKVTPSIRREFIIRFLIADAWLLNDNLNYLEGEPSTEWKDGGMGFHFVYTALNIPFKRITDDVPFNCPETIIRHRTAPINSSAF